MATGPTDPDAESSGSTEGAGPLGESGPKKERDSASKHGGSPASPPGATPPRAAASPPADGSESGGEETVAAASVPFTQQLGRVTIVVLAALFGVFAVANSQRVDFSWVFGETVVREAADGEMTGGVPLILLLLAAFAIGSAVTLLVELFVARARRARRAARSTEGDRRGKGRGR